MRGLSTKILKIQNLNSQVDDFSFIDEESIVPKLDYLTNKAFALPVYLVDEGLMDVLYPPEKKRCIDEEKARELLDMFYENDNQKESEVEWELEDKRDHENKKEKNLIDRIKNKMNELYTQSCEATVAVGLYLNGPGPIPKSLRPEFGHYIRKIKTPCVVICPERVVKRAERLNISLKISFERVYYHELAHAFIHSKYRDYWYPWYRTIEESFCNAVAVERFRTKKDITKAKISISEQSAEYRGYTFFTDIFFRKQRSLYYRDYLEDIYNFADRFVTLFSKYGYRFYKEMIIQSLSSMAFGDARSFRKLWNNKSVTEEFFIFLSQVILEEALI